MQPGRPRILLLCLAPLAGRAVLPAQDRLDPPAPRPEGVTPAIERAIENGLRYLARTQEPDGAWGAWPERPELYASAMTGLAGLAFLAHGNTPTRGPYAEVVRRATDRLLGWSTSNGLIASGYSGRTPRGDEERTMYGHAFAMTFLAQVLGHAADPQRRERIREVLHRAVRLTKDVQSDDGGWAYYPNYWEDEGTLTVTQLQGLRACRDAGIVVSKNVIDRGVGFIEKSSNPDGSVRYRVQDSRIRPGVTCAAVVALWNAGQYDTPLIRRTIDYMNRRITHRWQSGHHAEYVEYYLAQAKWVIGGQAWADFYPLASAELVGLQTQDGHWDESSDTEQYGTTYPTAVALLVLQLPYSRLPVYQR